MRTFAVSSLQADRPIARAAERVASDTQLIIADGLCPKIAELLPGALHDVVAVGTTADPLAAITATLAERRLQGRPVDTLHLVAHGRPGAFQIGGQWITTTSLIAAADQLAQWQVRTLALWSCEVGADEHFMALLAELSGAAVHSSRQAIRKGNWNLTARNSSPNDGPEAPFNESTQETWAHELAFSDYNYYATFNEVVTATYEGGSSFSTFVPVAGSVFRLYPANPFDPTSSVTEFFANGSTASVWLVIDGQQPAIELYLTNGAQASGGDGGPEDKWVIADAPNLNDATVFYVLASGTYQLNQAGEQINSSISLADLDELAQSQLVATVASVTADDPNSLEPGDNSVIEGNTLGFNVVLSGPNFVDTIFTYALAGGTTNPANPAADITLPITWSDGVVDNGDGTITVPAGVTSFSATVQTFDDAILELTESLKLTVGTASGEGFIIDNDFPAVDSVTPDDPDNNDVGDNAVVEGNSLRYDIVLNTAVVSPATYTYSLTGGITNPASVPADVTLPIIWSAGVTDNGDGTITVAAGVSTFSATVQTFDDTLLELTESLRLTVGGVFGTGNIIDNDFPTVDSVTPDDPDNNDVGDNAVVEGNSLRYDIVLNTAVLSPATYTYSLTGGITNPASVPADVTLPIIWSAGVTDNGDGTITVAAGVSTFSATVQTFDDTLLELTESLRLTVGGVFGTGNIIDNDFPAVDSVTPDDPDNDDVGDNAVVEGNSLRYDIVLNTAVLSPATYTYSLTGGTTNPAGVPADVTLPILWSAGVTDNGDGTITVAAGVSTFSATVQTFDDTLLELTESLRLTVGGVFGTGNIIDNDFPAVDSVTPDDPDNDDVGDNAVVEGNSLRYDIVLNTAVLSPATYTYSLTGGTTNPAGVPADVTLPILWSAGVTDNGDGTITVAAGVSTFSATVQTFDDTLLELTESLRLTVGGVFGTGNIIDNDFPAVDSVTPDDPDNNDVGDNAVVEGNSLRYDIALNTAVVSPATYTYSLTGGATNPASVPADVTLPIVWSAGVTDNGDGTITVATGVSSFFATVQTFDDTLLEFTESLKLTVGGVVGTGNIIDNDFPAVSSVTADDPQSGDVDDDAVIEGNALRYDVVLSAAVVSPATYTYSLSGGTTDPATVPDDVTLPIIWSEGVTDNGDGTITLATGVTSFFATVQTFDDELGELTESLKLTIGSTSGEGHIIDNDDNDGIPSSTETALAEILNPGSGGDANGDGIPDSEQPAVATLAWINTTNFTNAIEGDFPQVDPKSIITIESINNNGSVNNQTAFEDIEVVPFSVTDGQPIGIFTEWDPIEFTIVPAQGQIALPDQEARGGTQVKVFINISAADLPENYFDKYYTYISADVIEAYNLAEIPLVTLDGVNLDSADDAGWYDFTQRTAGGDGARYITEDGRIIGVEITFTDNRFGDDDPTANRIQDPSTLALEPDPQLGVTTDSGIIGDGVTGNGFAVLYMIGTPGSASRITLEGSDDVLLSKGANGNYIVEEIVIDEFRSVYAIKLLDADLDAAGAQAFGRYYTGKSTGNDDNTTDGFYTVLLDGQSAGEFEIRTAALSDRDRIKCLRQLNRNSGIDSRFFGFRIDNTRGTNGDDNIIGGNGNQTLKGLKGSDVLNAWGDRLNGVDDEGPIAIPALNQKDVLTGGKGADYFQLGDIVSAFYLGDGDNGYARITDFSSDDRLILSGAASDYEAIATSVGGQTGLGIYQGGDLIALVQGKARDALNGAGTELNGAQVVFL